MARESFGLPWAARTARPDAAERTGTPHAFVSHRHQRAVPWCGWCRGDPARGGGTRRATRGAARAWSCIVPRSAVARRAIGDQWLAGRLAISGLPGDYRVAGRSDTDWPESRAAGGLDAEPADAGCHGSHGVGIRSVNGRYARRAAALESLRRVAPQSGRPIRERAGRPGSAGKGYGRADTSVSGVVSSPMSGGDDQSPFSISSLVRLMVTPSPPSAVPVIAVSGR